MKRNRHVLTLAAAAVLALAVAGCDDRGALWSTGRSLDGPFEAGGRVLFPDRTLDRLTVFEVSQDELLRSTIAYPDDAPNVRALPDGKRLLLTDFEDRKIVVLTIADGTRVEYPLSSTFGALALSDDGDAALLYHPSGTSVSGEMVNTSEIAIVDLSAAPGGANPTVATVLGLSRAPTRAVAGPIVQAADGAHRLAWLEAVSSIGLVDVSPAAVRTAVVPLVPAGSMDSIVPHAHAFRSLPGILDLYLLATGSSDVVHLSVDVTGATLAVSLDQILSGAQPAALHVFEAADGPRVLTVNAASYDLALLDPGTGSGTYVGLEVPATLIRPYTAADGGRSALLWSPGQYTFLVADLDAIPAKKGKAVDPVLANAPISSVQPIDDGRLFLILTASSEAPVQVWESATGRMTAFGGMGIPAAVRLSNDGTAAFFLGTSSTGTVLSRLGLADLRASSLHLSIAPSGLVPIGSSGVAAVGEGYGGPSLLAFPAGVLDADGARFDEGFAFAGLM